MALAKALLKVNNGLDGIQLELFFVTLEKNFCL
jgi:hypothetical protein